MRLHRAILPVLGLILPLVASAATVAQIGMEEMAAKSTSVVKAKVLSARGLFRGDMIYTMYRVQVSEVWKGTAAAQIEIAVPGGVANGLRQVVAGSPSLGTGSDYVFFLWTGKSGLNQLIGLSQGALNVKATAQGDIAVRGSSGEDLVDLKTGKMVEDPGVSVKLADLKRLVRKAAAETRSEVQ